MRRAVIKRIYSLDETGLPDGYYGGKVNAYAKAYGFGYEFCRFFEYSGGIALINNSNCVIKGVFDTELEQFISFSAVTSLECPACTKDFLKGFKGEKRFLLERKHTSQNKQTITDTDFKLEDVYKIISSAFEISDCDLWYADASHRIRHGVSACFLLENKAAAFIGFEYRGAGYVSEVAVLPEARRKGLGSKLLSAVCACLSQRDLDTRLFAYESTLPFYLKNNFTIIGSDMYYTSKAYR